MTEIPAASSPGRRFRVSTKLFPYLLSLPALLVCIGILIPNRGMNWGENYLNFLTDGDFWNTLQVSLVYAFVTVGLELLIDQSEFRHLQLFCASSGI